LRDSNATAYDTNIAIGRHMFAFAVGGVLLVNHIKLSLIFNKLSGRIVACYISEQINCSYLEPENRIIITMNRIQVNGTLSPTMTIPTPGAGTLTPSAGTLSPSPTTIGGNSSLEDMSIVQLKGVANKLLSSSNLSPMEEEILNNLRNFTGQVSTSKTPEIVSPVNVGASSGSAGQLTAVGPITGSGSAEQLTAVGPITGSGSAEQLTAVGPITGSGSAEQLTAAGPITGSGSAGQLTAVGPITSSGSAGQLTAVGAPQSAVAPEQSQGNFYAATQFNDLLNKFESPMSQTATLTSVSIIA
jgi:hypothetical protein